MTLKCIIWPRPILMCLATRWRFKWWNGGLSHRLWSRRDGKQDMLDTPRAKMCSLTKKKYIMAPWSCLHFSVRGEETHFFILCLSEAVCYLKGDTTMCILFFFLHRPCLICRLQLNSPLSVFQFSTDPESTWREDAVSFKEMKVHHSVRRSLVQPLKKQDGDMCFNIEVCACVSLHVLLWFPQ